MVTGRAWRVVVLAAASLNLAAQVNTGEIRGTVLDPSGGVLTGVRVTAVDSDRGTTRWVQTDSQGSYSFTALSSGIYRMRFEASGFNTHVMEGVELRVGDVLVLETVMQVGTVTTEVNVTAEPPLIDPGRTQQANTLDLTRIENLPINRRNYLDFALLAPGVVETDHLVDDTDFRVAQTPQSGLSFGGSNGRGNMVSIDGMENYYNSGGVRPSLSQEAVQEFQINRNSFSAELGNAFGGVINIVSKSGTNEFRGNLFGFLRHRHVQARNYFDPGKSAFTRGQYGATAGGPLRRDKAFLFAAFERLDRQETAFVPILQDRSVFTGLTPSQQQLVDFFDASGSPQLRSLAAAMRQALIPANHPRTVALFDRNSGNFPFSEDTTQFSMRVDLRPSERHSVFVRGNMTKSFSQNAQFGALIGFNRGRSVDVFDGTVMANHTWVPGPRWVVETRAGYGYNTLDVQPTDPFGPEINISGFGFFGRDIFLPSTAFERHYQFQQHWSAHWGRHGLKFGLDINPVRDRVRSETFFSGRFSFGGRVPLGLVLNNFAGDPNFTTRLAETLAAAGQARLIPNLSAPLSALQAFSLGLPEFYQQGFGDPNWIGWSKRYNLFVQDAWRLSPRLTVNLGARYELEENPEPVRTDPNNIAGRIGLAWTPGAAAKTVIRAGYGLYYSQINIQVANVADTLAGRQIAQTFVPLTGIAGLLNPQTGRLLTAADIYQTLLAQGVIGRRSIRLEDLAQFGLRPSPTAPFAVVFGIVDDFVNPYAHQAQLRTGAGCGRIQPFAGLQLQPRRPYCAQSGPQPVLRREAARRRPYLRFLQPLDCPAQRLRVHGELLLPRWHRSADAPVRRALASSCQLHVEQSHRRGHGLQHGLPAARPAECARRARPVGLPSGAPSGAVCRAGIAAHSRTHPWTGSESFRRVSPSADFHRQLRPAVQHTGGSGQSGRPAREHPPPAWSGTEHRQGARLLELGLAAFANLPFGAWRAAKLGVDRRGL
ncbi:MAG: carboxypeptidase regulatory-like domain-containing protein [Bryobacterales bacterium]|nr:carboxypeptidase regulatory-like domain-containing protein [Bryobacterales bacterium]